MTEGTGSGPKFLAMFGPVLKAVRDLGGSAQPREVYEHVAQGLSTEVIAEQTPSGAPRHENQMGWARYYLVQAGLLDSSQRGVWTLTDLGREAGDLSHEQATTIFREIRERMAATKRASKDADLDSDDDVDEPDDDAEDGPEDHRAHVIAVLKSMLPSGFERFCQRLLREAGFQSVEVTGRSGDEGIDGVGVLRVNTLVSFKVLFQCKRYKDVVGPSTVRDFRGAMAGRADKGIILTTGRFTAAARKESMRDGVSPIELVDGTALVEMLERLKMGLVPVPAYRVDEAFFRSFDTVVGEPGA